MKKLIALMLCLTLGAAALLTGCSNPVDPNPEPEEYVYELISDNKFQNGFIVSPANNSPDTYPLDYTLRCPGASGDIAWTAAQWGSKFGLGDSYGNELITGHAPYEPVKTGNAYRYEAPGKAFVIDPVDGKLTFEVTTSVEYVDEEGNIQPRKTGTEMWCHLLIQQGFGLLPLIKDVDQIILNMDVQITKMENMFGDAAAEYNPNMHAAQFLMYLVVKSQNPADSEYMWFGIPLYDNRYQTFAENGMIDSGENKFLYGMPSNDYLPGGLTVGTSEETVGHISFDIVPYFERALNICKTQFNRFQSSTVDDLYIQGMNLGWEVPGVFDVSATVSNFSLKAYCKKAID